MRTVTLSWESSRDIIAALYADREVSMQEHVDRLESQLEEHAPSELTVTLALSEEAYRCSVTWVRVKAMLPPMVTANRPIVALFV
jgi:hypothetical protein